MAWASFGVQVSWQQVLARELRSRPVHGRIIGRLQQVVRATQRGALRRPHGIWPAVKGGALWGGIQGGAYAVPLLMMALMGKGEAAFFALVGLEMSLILGAGAGFFIGTGFWMTRT